MSHTTKVCCYVNNMGDLHHGVSGSTRGGGCWLHVLFCPILCHNLQLWRTLNTTNDTPASLLSEDWESNILQFHHVASSFSKTLDFQFWPTMTPYSWQTSNYFMLPHLLIVLHYGVDPHLFKLQKNAHRNIKRLKVITKDKAVNTTTSNSILSVVM